MKCVSSASGRALADELRREIQVVVVQEHRSVRARRRAPRRSRSQSPRSPARSRFARRRATRRRDPARTQGPTCSAAGTTSVGFGDDVVEAVERGASCATSRSRYGEPSRHVSSNASPPCSSATARSSSLIALAIHVTSCCATRLRSAVTRPPPPRRVMRVPVRRARVRHRAAVRDHDQLPPRRHCRGTYPAAGRFRRRSPRARRRSRARRAG